MKSSDKNSITRRGFIKTTGATAAGSLLVSPAFSNLLNKSQGMKKVALVGTGIRGITFFGKFLKEEYADVVEFTGLCDINAGRAAYAKEYIGVNCPVYTNFDDMLNEAEIDLLMVTTVDSTHDEFIVKGLDKGLNVVTEKPMTTDEKKCQRIIDAQRQSKGKLIMAFNYRYGKLFTKLKEIILSKEIGELVSIDLNWYLNTYHGASYFRRWHGL
jgi:predicted dehydrogenase